MTLPVAEIFGPTLQGEGPSAGRRAVFLRLGGCNLHCSWCDTPWTWDASRFNLREQLTPTSLEDIIDRLGASAELLVITGGEPLLHQQAPDFRDLLDWARWHFARIEIETNGTVVPTRTVGAWAHLNVSPKLAHAGDPEGQRIRPAALKACADLARVQRAVFKFVCRDVHDLDEVAHIAEAHSLPPAAIWVMPEGAGRELVVDRGCQLAPAVAGRGWNFTTRLHLLVGVK